VPSCRSARGSLGTSRAKPACARPPKAFRMTLLPSLVQFLLPDPSDVRLVSVLPGRLASSWVVVPLLPLPVDAAELVALALEDGPDLIEDLEAHPALEGPMDRGVVAELTLQLVPLNAAAQSVGDPVEGAALVDPLASDRLGRVVLCQDRLDLGPELVGGPPDRGRWSLLGLSLLSGHRRPPVAYPRHNLPLSQPF
jgi:hypothetical protein